MKKSILSLCCGVIAISSYFVLGYLFEKDSYFGIGRGLLIWAIVLIFSILAINFARKAKLQSESKTLSNAGVSLGVIGIIIFGVVLGLYLILIATI